MRAHMMAERKSLHALANCFLREVVSATRCEQPEAIRKRVVEKAGADCLMVSLARAGGRLCLPLQFYSPLGMHRYLGPLFIERGKVGAWEELGLAEFVAICGKEMASDDAQRDALALEDLRTRVEDSCATMAMILRERQADLPQIFEPEQCFLAAEQSLLLGHPLHPVPKSRIGFSEDEKRRYSPETKGVFALHFFAVAPDLVRQDTACEVNAANIVQEFLWRDAEANGDWVLKGILERHRHAVLVPMHPWQARNVLESSTLQPCFADGRMVYLGPLGQPFRATSSIRTVGRDDLPWMIKLSLGIEITNSRRLNKERELIRATEAYRLLHTGEFGDLLRREYPEFFVITDPAVIAVTVDGVFIEEMACTFRQNPFHHEHNVSLVAALCQDHPDGGEGRLARLIEMASSRLAMTREEAALVWFERYWRVAIRPLVSLYVRFGLAFEAHQQNILVEMDRDGMPCRAFYRDNQGIFHRDTAHEMLCQFVPEIGEESGSIGPEALVDERLAYYLILNNACAVADALAWQTGLSVEELLAQLRWGLEDMLPLARMQGASFVSYLLSQVFLPAKANLRTRWQRMDELDGDPRFQSVYQGVGNPLAKVGKRETEAFEPIAYRDALTMNVISFRVMDVARDFDLYHHWMNQGFVAKWWKLAKTRGELREHLATHAANMNQTLYIGFINGKAMSYWERYWLAGDLLGEHVNHRLHDQGIHFLIGDPAFLDRKHADRMLITFTRLCFDVWSGTEHVYGEPDASNQALLKYAEATGFERLGTVDLPGKTAALMVCPRDGHERKYDAITRI